MSEPRDQRVSVYREQEVVPADTFTHLRYVVKRPLFQLFDRRHDVFTPDGRLAMRAHSPVFKLRDVLTLYADAEKTQPLLELRQRKAIQLSTEWDVTDVLAGEAMGTVRKRFGKSLLRDHWDILSASGEPRGQLVEVGHALLRRFFPFLTSEHQIEIDGRVVARIKQRFRFFSKEFHLDLTPAAGGIDTRLAIACTILVLAAEANRENN